jgi:hypothetical protein
MICEKCNGSGWVWCDELDYYDGPAIDPYDCYSDDTRYICDWCDGTGEMDPGLELNIEEDNVR